MVFEETDLEYQYTGYYTNIVISMNLVSCCAGDSVCLPHEQEQLEELKISRGDNFYSDLLFTITHQYFPAPESRELWHRILQHKYEMSILLNRNIRVTVAALDFLSNLTRNISSATVIDETQIGHIMEMSLRDSLTNLYNHAYFYSKLRTILQDYWNHGSTVSLLLLDLDNFKELNDTFGHQEGDRVLAGIGTLLMASTRPTDICCRYGGDEFSIIMPSTVPLEADFYAERLKHIISARNPCGHKIEVSVGISSSNPYAVTPEEMFQVADLALYEAKYKGKNQVVTH